MRADASLMPSVADTAAPPCNRSLCLLHHRLPPLYFIPPFIVYLGIVWFCLVRI